MTLRDDLRNEIQDTQRAFHRLLEDVPIDAYPRRSDNPAWNIGQVLFHMSIAPRMMVQDVSMITRQRKFYQLIPWLVPQVLFDWVNQVYTQQAARNPSKDFLTGKYDRATTNILRTLESVRDDDFAKSARYPGWDPLLFGSVTLHELFRYVGAHFRVHEDQIRRRL